MEQTEALLREHDSASRFRTGLGAWVWIVGGLSIALTLFHLVLIPLSNASLNPARSIATAVLGRAAVRLDRARERGPLDR